jgi:hypothetical protein
MKTGIPFITRRACFHLCEGGIFIDRLAPHCRGAPEESRHRNLYYILQQDQQAHPMPEERVLALKAKIFPLLQNFSQKVATNSDP